MDVGNRSVIRKQNQQKIVEYIMAQKGASRAEVAKALSLSKPASSENIGDLIDRNILVEGGIAETIVGKKGTLLQLNASEYAVLIVDITTAWLEKKIQIFLCDFSCKILYTTEIFLQSENDINNILKQISDWIYTVDQQEKIQTIVVSVSGVMKEETEQHLYMEMLNHISCKQAFEQYFKIDTYVYNDVNLMAMGEQHQNNKIDEKNIAYVWLDVAVGGAIILNEALYEGTVGGAGEFGFIPVMKQEGKGVSIKQLHEYISISAIERRLGEEWEQSAFCTQIKARKGQPAFSDFIAGVQQGDSYCVTLAEDIAYYVAYGCQVISAVLDLEVIILGGHLTALGDSLKRKVEKQLQTLGYNKTRVLIAQVENASFYGAGYLGTKTAIKKLIFI